MANDARVTFVGTVIQEPTNRQSGNGTTIFSMKVAVQTTKRVEGKQWPETDIYDVSVWGKPGESLIDKVHAKTKVWVCGDMCMGEPWEDRNKKTHISPRVNASTVKITSTGKPESKSEEDEVCF